MAISGFFRRVCAVPDLEEGFPFSVPLGGSGGGPPGIWPRRRAERRRKPAEVRPQSAGVGPISADALPGGTDGPKMVHKMVQEGLESPKDRPKTPKMASRRPREPQRRLETLPKGLPGEAQESKIIVFLYVGF